MAKLVEASTLHTALVHFTAEKFATHYCPLRQTRVRVARVYSTVVNATNGAKEFVTVSVLLSKMPQLFELKARRPFSTGTASSNVR